MECEVKDAEINILRRRIQSLQEQVSPNGNSATEHVPTPSEDKASHTKVQCMPCVFFYLIYLDNFRNQWF